MAKAQKPLPLSRRDVLRTAATIGGWAIVSPVLEACSSLGGDTSTPPALTALSEAHTATPRPTLTVVSSPTATAAPASTRQTSPTATEAPAATSRPEPTATTQPSPSASPAPTAAQADGTARVAFVKTSDRAEGVRRALALLGVDPGRGNRVLLKPNFNSADPAPGSTHDDVLRTLVQELWVMGAKSITVADRSGMGNTRRVMEQKGIFGLADELGFDTLVFDDLDDEGWVLMEPHDSYWEKGFFIARSCLETDALVQACCLKTHRFGGHFTLSLKNSVGLVAKFGPGDGYNYMSELHSSPHQRRMIADINAAYEPALVVMDGVEAFVTGGPANGKLVRSEVVLAGTDRIAIDAVGVALLRHFGTTPEVGRGPIFELEQIARAVDLGLGVNVPEKIELITDDQPSAAYANTIRDVLLQA
jgi:uncharacterized protein (DUF362 family)